MKHVTVFYEFIFYIYGKYTKLFYYSTIYNYNILLMKRILLFLICCVFTHLSSFAQDHLFKPSVAICPPLTLSACGKDTFMIKLTNNGGTASMAGQPVTFNVSLNEVPEGDAELAPAGREAVLPVT